MVETKQAPPHERTGTVERRHRRRWVPISAGWMCLLIGLVNVVGSIKPDLHDRILGVETYFPGVFSSATRSATLVTGMLLLLLSHGLRRRKRRGWRAAITLLGVNVIFHVLKDHEISALVSVAVLVSLIYYRAEFYAVGDPRTRWRALWVGILLAVSSVCIGLLYTVLNARYLAGDYSLTQRFEDVLMGLFGVHGDVGFVSDHRGDFYNYMLLSLGLTTALTTVYLFLRPAEPLPVLTSDDERRIRAMLQMHGARDSLGYFSLRRDKSVIWSTSGKACITYRVVSGVMLAGGDPVGDPEAWPGAIQAFLAEAERHAWVPAVMGCSELAAEVWCRDSGLSALELGDEAIIDVGAFSLDGRTMRNVRQMVNRVGRQGYVAEVRREKDFTPEELSSLWRQASAWRGSDNERGFSMALGRVGEPGDEECVIATATQDGDLHAFLHFVPWGPDGLSLDLMRRDRDAQPGLNDYLIAETIGAMPELGVKRVSLNFAVFRAALARGERIGAGPVMRAWRGLLIFLSRWFQIESLYKFNAKFQPEWEPRFFVYPGLNDAPRVALAALEAEAFIVWPRLRIPGLGPSPKRCLPAP